MTKIKYTKKMALADLKAAVAKYGPDTTYAKRYKDLMGVPYNGSATCRNKLLGQPACIVGVALSERFGAENVPAGGSVGAVFDGAHFVAGPNPVADTVAITDKALLVLAEAQNRQDRGQTWGEAVADL